MTNIPESYKCTLGNCRPENQCHQRKEPQAAPLRKQRNLNEYIIARTENLPVTNDFKKDFSRPFINDFKNLEIDQMLPFYINNKDNLKFANVNINSVRHKFPPLAEVLGRSMIDILSIQETKLDDSFPDSQFSVLGYQLHRKDHRSNSGGLMMLIRDDLPQQRRQDLENVQATSGRIELMVIETMIYNEIWLMFNLYKQPKVKNSCIIEVLEYLIDKCRQNANNILLFGDLNINMMNPNNCLKPVFDVLGVKNLVTLPTCFKSNEHTLIDLLVTNVPKRLQNVTCIDCELSDCHKMVCWATKMKAPGKINKVIQYRSYKNFDESKFKQELASVPFHVSEIFDNTDDSYWFCHKLLVNIINEHAPPKTRQVKYKQVPYMNSGLRKSINVRNMLRRKFEKCKTHENWIRYKTHRNQVSYLRRKSLQLYIKSRCNQSAKGNGKEFWTTIKPLISFKNKGGSSNITLLEGGKIINNPVDVVDVLNKYYVSATENIGLPDKITGNASLNDITKLHDNKECITTIRNHMKNDSSFKFSRVSSSLIYEKLNGININKSTGHDMIPPKLIKLGAKELCVPITYLINKCIETSTFPKYLKLGEITPVFKKENMLDKRNYRPISTLPCLSKIFEGVFVEQLQAYFEDIFSPYMSGFRKNHNCQSVLLLYVENCKASIDCNNIYGSLLTDLSMAFDCLPHGLLISKLKAYGVCEEACMLIANYFQGRMQRVKIGNNKSDWMEISKGCPQGSLFGPLAYNIFSNDLLLSIQNICDIYNYADDNSIGYSANTVAEVTDKLNSVASLMMEWFESNSLQANPNKFHYS